MRGVFLNVVARKENRGEDPNYEEIPEDSLLSCSPLIGVSA